MKSFFSAIQHWFTGDLYGRHLGLILQEVGNRRPDALTTFISDVFCIPRRNLKTARFEAEYTFAGARGPRRADVAVFTDEDEEPTILVEIKYHDKPLPETERKPAQLADYRAWRDRKSNRYVLLISRELYAAEGIQIRRWNDLAHHLRPYAERSDLIDMLVGYLEDEGNVMQNISGVALTKYMKRYLCNGKPGANNVDGPVEFSNLLKNVQLMSGVFHGHFKAAWKNAGLKIEGESYDRRSKVASIDFNVWNRLKSIAEGKSAVDDFGGLRSELKNGGQIYVFARHSLGHNGNWLRVRYGVMFDVSPDDNESAPPQAFLFADVRGAALERAGANPWADKKIHYRWVTDDAEKGSGKAEQHLNKLILSAIDQVLDAKMPLLAQQKKALLLLRKSLGSGRQPLLAA
ncbi:MULTISPECIES: hypothetical protein [Paraburkholderia]|uniref:PD-(D/E)XK nuclease superfamily protein n=1 Tax=Paraburkholderia madseniana TaxID=2599607 RepID=A0AAP5BLZ1_9BURK|nr:MULTISPECIES: hypothetical protein [Paraburkholderia]MCX4152251.1 hypothetical protein [Paraburkholderia madseniana]MDN7155180.1 hypothetical protein [Paraburkholderia sp. WS6]MDQ6414063.1 hypothetical protein [Paraburkholderia madseniana]